MAERFFTVPAEQACCSKNHSGPRRRIRKGARVDACTRCGKYTCTDCEGTSLFSDVCDACWLPTLVERTPSTYEDFWHALDARAAAEASEHRRCVGLCNKLGWTLLQRHASGYWCAQPTALRREDCGEPVLEQLRISAPTAAELRRLVKLCARALAEPLIPPPQPAPPPLPPPPEDELEELDASEAVELPPDAPTDLPSNVVPLRQHPQLGWEVQLGRASGTGGAS